MESAPASRGSNAGLPFVSGPRGPLILVGLVLVAYSGHVPGTFVYDDWDGLHQNPVVNGELPLWAAFTRDFWGMRAAHTVGTYRPLSDLFLGAVWRLGGGAPGAFRVASVLLHLTTVLTAFAVLKRIVSTELAWITAALLAVFAACSEAVLCHVGNADILCALVALVGLAAHRRPGLLGSVVAPVAVLLALGAKETGLVVPAAWLAVDLCLPSPLSRRQRAARFVSYALATLPYFVGRIHTLGALTVPSTNSPLHNPLLHAGFLGRELGAAEVFLTRYVGGILLPQRRLYDCSAQACGPASLGDPLAWLGLGLFALCLVAPLLLRRRAPVAAVGLAWFVLFFLPASNLLVLGPTIYGERLLYLPLLGLSLAVAAGIQAASSRWTRPAVAFSMLGVVLAGNLIADRAQVKAWSSGETLDRSGLTYAADSALVQVNLAIGAATKKDYPTVERYARRSIELYPQGMLAHRELASVLYATGRMDEARHEFETAYSLGRDDTLVHDYAAFLGRNKEYAKGLAMVQAALAEHPKNEELRVLGQRLQWAVDAERQAGVPRNP